MAEGARVVELADALDSSKGSALFQDVPLRFMALHPDIAGIDRIRISAPVHRPARDFCESGTKSGTTSTVAEFTLSKWRELYPRPAEQPTRCRFSFAPALR